MAAKNSSVYPIVGFASLALFIYMSFSSTSLRPFTPTPKLSFVTVNSTQFYLNGAPFYVNGWNSYWLMDQAVETHSLHRVTSMFDTASRLGLTVCRTWAFNDGTYNALQVSLGRFDERVFKALDRVVMEARQRGIRLLLSLANNLQAYGGKTQYVKWAWEDGIGLSASNDSFFFDPAIRGYFKLYIKTILTRKNHLTGIEYRDDPTIFAWELINEPRCLSDVSGDTLQEWIEDMAGYVKSIDTKHLLTVGLEGFYGPTSPPAKLAIHPIEWDSQTGADFIRNSKTPAIDFASAHFYPDQWLLGAELEEKMKFVAKWINSHIEDGERVLQKPVLFTEFGISNIYKNYDHSHRETMYKFIYELIRKSAKKNRAGAGALVWQLMAPDMVEYSDNYGIVPEEIPSIYRLIKDQSCQLSILRQMSKGPIRGPKPTC